MQSTSSPLCQWLKTVENKRRKEVLHEMTKTLLELKLNENGIKTAFKQLSNTCKVVLERCDNKDDETFKRSGNGEDRKPRKKLKLRNVPPWMLEEQQQKIDTLSTDTSNSSRKFDSDRPTKSIGRLEEEKLQRAIYDSYTGSSSSSNRNTNKVLENEVMKELQNSSSSSKMKIVRKPNKKLKRKSNSPLNNPSKSTKRKSGPTSIERLEENQQSVVKNSSNISSFPKKSEDVSLARLNETSDDVSFARLKETSENVSFARLKETVKRKMHDVPLHSPKRRQDDSPVNLSTPNVSFARLKETSENVSFARLKEKVKCKMLDVSPSSPKGRQDDSSVHPSIPQVTPSTPAKDSICRNKQIRNFHSEKVVEVIKIESDDEDISSTSTISDCNIADNSNLKLNSKEISTIIPENLCDSRNSCNKQLPEQNKEHLSKENKNLNKNPFPQTLLGLLCDESQTISKSCKGTLENKQLAPVCESPQNSSVEVGRKEKGRPIGFIKVKDPASLGINIPNGYLPENALSCGNIEIVNQNPNTSSSCDNQLLNQPNNVTYNVNTPTSSGPCNVTVGNNNISIYLQMGLSDINNQLECNGTITKSPNQCSSNSSTDLLVTNKSNVNSSEACSQACSGMTNIVHMDRVNETSTTIDTGGSNQNTTSSINFNNSANPTIPQSQSTLIDEIIRSMTQNCDHTYTAQKTPNYSTISKPSDCLEKSYSILKNSGPKTGNFKTSKKKGSQVKDGTLSTGHHHLPHVPFKTYSGQNKDRRMSQHNINSTPDLQMSTLGGNNYDTQYFPPSFSSNASEQTKSFVPRKSHYEIQCSTHGLNKNNMNPEVSQPSLAVMSSCSKNLPKDTSITDLSSNTCNTARNIAKGHNTITSQPVPFQSSANVTVLPKSTALYSPAPPTNNINSQALIAKPISEKSQIHDKADPLPKSIVMKVQSPSRINLPASSTNSSYKLNPGSVTDNTQKSVTSVSSINISNEHSSSITSMINSKSCKTGLESTNGMKEQQSLHHSNIADNKSQKCSSTYPPPDSMLPAAEGTVEVYDSTNSHVNNSNASATLSTLFASKALEYRYLYSHEAATDRIEYPHETATNRIEYPHETATSTNVLDELDLAKIQQMYQTVKNAIIDNALKELKLGELDEAPIYDLSKYDRLIKRSNHLISVLASTFVSLLIRFLKKSSSKGMDKKEALMVVFVKILEHFLVNNEMESCWKKFQKVVSDLLEAYNLHMEQTDESLLSEVFLVMRLPPEVFDIAIAIAARTVYSPIEKFYDMNNYDLTKYSFYITKCIQSLSLVRYLDKCSKFFALKYAIEKHQSSVAPNPSTKKLVEPSSSNSSNGNTPASLKKPVESSNNSAGIPLSCPSVKKPVEQSSNSSVKNILVAGPSLKKPVESSVNNSAENNSSLSHTLLKKPVEQSSKYSEKNIPVSCQSLKKPFETSSNNSARSIPGTLLKKPVESSTDNSMGNVVPALGPSLRKPVESMSDNSARNIPVSGPLLKKPVESLSANSARNIPVSGPLLKKPVESSSDNSTENVFPALGPPLKKPVESLSQNSTENVLALGPSLKKPVESMSDNSARNIPVSGPLLKKPVESSSKNSTENVVLALGPSLKKPVESMSDNSARNIPVSGPLMKKPVESSSKNSTENVVPALGPSLKKPVESMSDNTARNIPVSGPLMKKPVESSSKNSTENVFPALGPSLQKPVESSSDNSGRNIPLSGPSLIKPAESSSNNSSMYIPVSALSLNTPVEPNNSLQNYEEKNNVGSSNSNLRLINGQVRREIQLIDALPLKTKTLEKPRFILLPRSKQTMTEKSRTIVVTRSNLSSSTIQNMKKQLIQSNPSLLAHSFKVNDSTSSQFSSNIRKSSDHDQATIPNKDLPPSVKPVTENHKATISKQVDTSDLCPIIIDVRSLPDEEFTFNFDTGENLSETTHSTELAHNLHQATDEMEQELTYSNKPQATNITVQKSANPRDFPATNDVVVPHNSVKSSGSQAINDAIQEKSANMNKTKDSSGIPQKSPILDKPQATNITVQKSANPRDFPATNDVVVPHNSVKSSGSQAWVRLIQEKSANMNKTKDSSGIPQKSPILDKPQATNITVQISASSSDSQATNYVDPQNTEKLGTFQAENNENSQKPSILNKPQATNITVQKSSNPNEAQPTNNLTSQCTDKLVDPHATRKMTSQVSSAIPNNPQVSSVVMQNSENAGVSQATMNAVPQESSAIPDKPEASSAVLQKPANPSDSQATKNVVLEKCSPSTNIVEGSNGNRNVIVKVVPSQPGGHNPVGVVSKLGSIPASSLSSKDVNPTFKHNLPQQLEAPRTSLGNRVLQVAKPKEKCQPIICKKTFFLPNDIKKTIQNDIRNTLDQRYGDRCLYCERSGRIRKAFVQCSVCKTARYCDEICQTLDTPFHLIDCRPLIVDQ